MPMPPSQVTDVFGQDMTTTIVLGVYQALASNPANRPLIGYLDVRNFLAEEVNAAYIFLGQRTCDGQVLDQEVKNDSRSPLRLVAYNPSPDAMPIPAADPAMNRSTVERMAPSPTDLTTGQYAPVQPFWNNTFCGKPLATAVRSRAFEQIRSLRIQYLNCITQIRLDAAMPCLKCADPKCDEKSLDTRDPTCKTLTAALGWGLLVESSLLNEQLNQDYYEARIAKGMASDCGPRQCYAFYGPDPSPQARQAFIEYVECRWPVRVFALDPVVEMQNVEDSYSRHRQLQIALAMGFASGKINAQSMMKFARQLDWDMQAVALNETAVGFSHGDDTFGWRFYPRFQTPPNQGNAAAFWQSLAGGPTTDQDMRRRQLEPMSRECVAIVIMPSFVPYVTFDTRTRYFKLTNAEHGEVSMRETLELSRSIKAMQNSAAQCSACAQLYRDGEVDRLLRRVHQLDRSLPLQTMRVQLPFENTAGGFELFNRGVTDLSPELIGWYGAPGIDAAGTTTLFLVGRSFAVNGMQVIAGGRAIAGWSMLSRQVLQVTIPPGSEFLIDDAGNKLVDVHAATAYGVTDHLLIPIAPTQTTKMSTQTDLAFVPMQTAVLTYTTTAATSASSTNTYAAQGYSSPKPYIEITLPQASPVLQPALNVNLYLLDPSGTVMGTQTGVTFVYSPQTARYGTQLDGVLWASGKGTIADAVQSYLKSTYATKPAPATLNFSIAAQVVPAGSPSNNLLVPVSGGVGLQIKSH
jgi:hypothetical protein